MAGVNGALKISPMPSDKTDINDGCQFSTDYLGGSFDWPEASDARRAELLDDHIAYTKGLLWFIASDPRVPAAIRTEFSQFGYPSDEYVHSDHFSPQLYVREARRLEGAYVMRQQDCWDEIQKADSIGCGSYGVDSHHVQRVVIDGRIYNEGNFLYGSKAYEIPYRAITPRREDCTNLLVPVCLSASHVAFGSIRMEPVWMILGESAAEAAVQAIAENCSVQEISIDRLQSTLEAAGQRLRV